MNAIILCAGQGRRLLPLTADVPKCLLKVGGQPILAWQLMGLASAGVHEVCIVTGFRAEAVEAAASILAPRHVRIQTVHNPFFAVAENIGSCFLSRHLLRSSGTILLNGDTLFEPEIARRLLTSPEAPITVTTDRKQTYDADDMKVSLDGSRLRAVAKTLAPEETDGESIGMLLFRGTGGGLFAAELEHALREADGLGRWYLSVVDALAKTGVVQAASIEGLSWAEIDYPLDLARADAAVRSWPGPELQAVAGWP